jgi:hypothetical protein
MAFELREEDGILRIRLSGTLTNVDLSRCGEQLAALEDARAVVPHRLSDLRPVDRLEIDLTGILGLAEARRRRTYANPFKSAIIAPDIVHFGCARMFQTLNDHPQIAIAIFEGIEPALAWLRVPDHQLPKDAFEPRPSWLA